MTGFEPLIGAAAAGLGSLITSLVKEKGGETLKRLDWDIGKNFALKKAMVDYVRRYIDRHGTLKVACVRMDYPVRLDEIYTAVQLLDRSALRYFESEDALQTQYRKSGQRSFSVTRADKTPGLQVANEQQYLMVLGGPGVGKSTFLRKVGLEALRTLGRCDFAGKDPENLLVPQKIFYQHPRIPVMLELRQFDQSKNSIKAVIAKELDTCGFPHPEELTELFLKNGKLLVLLDGLDEVPSATLNHAITEIENLVDRYGDNRYIASCRVAAYTFGGFRRFKDVAMAAFDDTQIQRFIKNWFQKERDTETNTADRCWELLNSPEYQAAKELAQTPLLLTLLCVVYDEFQDFPKKRHALYGEALDVLLRKWAAEKRIQRNPIYQELSAELELDMLAEIAYTSFVDDQLFFSKDRLIEQIREFLISNLNAPKHLDAETVLKEIEIQQGILVERARDAYSFSHLTFQEYLTAKCIVDNQKIDQLVRDHVTEEQWQEVFLLVAGLAPGKQGADGLLLAMERQAQKYLSSRKLQAMMAWAAKATQNSPGDISPPAKRIAALFLVFSLERDLALDLYLDEAPELLIVLVCALKLDLNLDRALNYARDLDLAGTIDPKIADSLDRVYNYNRNQDCFEALYYGYDLSFDRDRFLKLALNLAKEYEELGIFDTALINSLILDISNLIFDEKTSKIDNKKTTSKIIEIYSDNLGYQHVSALSLRQRTHESLNYFYILELIICCKDEAVRVSPQVWAGIESRIATVPEAT
jgi:hypothetical protein